MANGQTCIQYGELRLYRCQTRRIEQRPVMDIARVNMKCWRFVVQVTGYLHGFNEACKYAEVVTSPATPPPESGSQAHQQVRWRLLPRQTFKMAVGCTSTDINSGTVILYADPMTGVVSPADLAETGLSNYDVDDGPRCTQFDVVHVSADNIFRVEATFEIHLVQCDDDGAALNNTTGVLAHRWSCADSLDHNLRTTRTYRGLLELATSNFSPHWFRYLVVPPLQPGMRRDHIQFVATEDGKRLQYTIVDTEVAISAPPPARRWSVEHTERSLNQDGLKVTSQISVTLEGASDVDKGQLIVLGLYIVSAKLQGSKPGEAPDPPQPIFFNDISITDLTGDVNVVRVSASCWRYAQDIGGLAVRADGFRKVITADDLPAFVAEYDPKRSAEGYDGDEPALQGPVPLAGIFRTYLQTSCANIGGISGSQIGNGDLEPAAGPRTESSMIVAPSLADEPVPWYSESHASNMYTTFQMESVYKTNAMRAAMPIASIGNVGGGFDTSNAVSIIDLSRPQTRRIVRMHAERVGQWPEFPDPESLDGGYATVPVDVAPIGQRVLHSRLLGGTVTKSAAGEDIYRARMEIVYALSRPFAPIELLKFGSNKWAADEATVSNPVLTNSSY